MEANPLANADGFFPFARKMLLDAHKRSGNEALADGIVGEIAQPSEMLDVTSKKAKEIQGRAKMGVYRLLRNERRGEASEAFLKISYVHGKVTNPPLKAKI
ncbi:uncharacterized protein N0V89_002369 [Didymosphaeria variabile]|uniref:Uncharacterized protein n=1 Tax=Didymosphaeria variabile TaxID=1932322 RepID=A0A9W8XTD4_9PLEO|nr:uncharacterized protein N0V89_002369 [Didymosphaeria variabile]KAJ4357793.1 hypothetical protein N0V89_002369 [Didymosphaeria variabile]